MFPKLAEQLREIACRNRTTGDSLRMRGHATAPPSPREKLSLYSTLIWITLFAFALRLTVRWYIGGSDFWENGYGFFFALAKNIAAGNGFAFDDRPATAFRVPLYPMFLATVTFGRQLFLPVVIAQSLIGAATVWCAAMIARELFGNTATLITAILTAIYPYYVVHDTALQETSLYTFLITLAVLQLLRVRRSGSVVTGMGAGLALGAGVLTRANLAPFALFAPLWLAIASGPRAAPWRRRLLVSILCASVGAMTVLPWLIRSYQLTGSASLGTQTGFFLWLGNNPHTFSLYPTESIDRSEAVAVAAMSAEEIREFEARRFNELALDQWFWKKGLDYIQKHPWQTLGNGFRKIVDTFGWLPSPRRSFWPSLIHALSYGPIMILGLWGMWTTRQHWREHAIFYAQFASFVVVTAVFFGHTSYRVYLDVYWIVFAAGNLAALLSKHLHTGANPKSKPAELREFPQLVQREEYAVQRV
jgi:4-amino-4-deoxy-L-arabinose transferase-like glycosyltransferase